MRTIRTKLLLVIGTAVAALLAVVLTSTFVANSVSRDLALIEQRHIPKLELGPQLDADFEAMRRGFQDGVAAHDADAIERAIAVRDRMAGRLTSFRDVLDPSAAAAFRLALFEYAELARDVSRRMIAGESGERLIDAMSLMQTRQARARELLKNVTAFERQRLGEAFASVSHAQALANRVRLVISVGCLLAVLALSLLVGRSALRSLVALEAGFARFGDGHFEDRIRLSTNDELARVAEKANRMAESLQRNAADRDRSDWLKAGLMGLSHEVQGELEPAEVARGAVFHLAVYTGAPAAALYAFDAEGSLELLGEYAGAGSAAPPRSLRIGEGLVGQAATRTELLVVDAVPAGYLRVSSGLGEAAPSVLVLVPLVRGEVVRGVLELALFGECSERIKELLLAARETIAVKLEIAQRRSEARALLVRTQDLAERLSHQDEELRATNEELEDQQQELRQANEELEVQRGSLEEQNAELERARGRLEQKAKELATVSSYKSQFLTNMSHELRTPLNSMLLLSSLLAENTDKALSESQVEYARTIHSAGQDLLALINQVLDLAKVEAGKQEVHVQNVRLQGFADHAARVFGPLARDKGLRFEVEVDPSLPETIATDGQRVVQVLNNLLGNAIKFTEQGEVALRIARCGEDARIRRADLDPATAIALVVTDTGVGISREDQERVFVPFEQVDGASDRRYGGTGLGLSIAREFASLLGGELQLRSTPGAGSTFLFYLPRAIAGKRVGPPRSPAPARVASPPLSLPVHAAQSHATSARAGDTGRLLVIEDDPVFGGVMRHVIQDHGLVCALATTGASGLELARREQPNGIVLDIKLPDMDGFHVLDALRNDPLTAAIPVHVVSAIDLPDRGIQLGAIGYLRKPAGRLDLVRVVESLAPKLRQAVCRILAVEDDGDGESILQKLAGENVEAHRASSAGEALARLSAERFDCLIVDLSLPDMDGLEFLDALQSKGDADMPAIVVYTSRALNRAEASRLEAYAEAVILREGSSGDRLLEEIRLFVRRTQEGLGTRRSLAARTPAIDVRLEGKTVLVVDDDMRTVYALSATLRAKGAEVLVADNGAVALSMLDEHPHVSAVLMDVMMPEMDGYEATRRIRQQPRFRALPIIALTAKAMKSDREQCLLAGATDYLPKPIDAVALLSMLHARIEEGAAPPRTKSDPGPAHA
jgi:CheY-like chemotaxis protein